MGVVLFLKVYCCISLIAATRAEGGLVNLFVVYQEWRTSQEGEEADKVTDLNLRNFAFL